MGRAHEPCGLRFVAGSDLPAFVRGRSQFAGRGECLNWVGNCRPPLVESAGSNLLSPYMENSHPERSAVRELILTSAEDGATLRLSCPDRTWGSIIAEARGTGFDVSAPVFVDMAPSLPDFFDEIAAAPDATPKNASWETLEGELRLEAKRDSTGHIFIVFHLRSSDIGSHRWWSFTGRLVLELGAMDDMCKRARRFWNAAA